MAPQGELRIVAIHRESVQSGHPLGQPLDSLRKVSGEHTFGLLWSFSPLICVQT